MEDDGRGGIAPPLPPRPTEASGAAASSSSPHASRDKPLPALRELAGDDEEPTTPTPMPSSAHAPPPPALPPRPPSHRSTTPPSPPSPRPSTVGRRSLSSRLRMRFGNRENDRESLSSPQPQQRADAGGGGGAASRDTRRSTESQRSKRSHPKANSDRIAEDGDSSRPASTADARKPDQSQGQQPGADVSVADEKAAALATTPDRGGDDTAAAAAATLGDPGPYRPIAPELLPLLATAMVATVALALTTARYLHWSLSLLEALGAAALVISVLERRERDGEWIRMRRDGPRADELTKHTETVEWLNRIVKVAWPLINAAYFEPFVDLLEDALLQQVPSIVFGCRVEDLSQGTIPLRITSFRVLPSDDDTFLGKSKEEDENEPSLEEEFDTGDYVTLEVKFVYRAPAKRRRLAKSNKAKGVEDPAADELELDLDEDLSAAEQIHMLLYMGIGAKLAAIEVPVWCEVVGLEGTLRLRLQMTPVLPFIKNVAITFVGKPRIEISAKPLGRRMVVDAMHLPLLSSYVLHSIERVIAGFIAPKSYTIDLAGLLGAGDGPSDAYNVGVVVVVVHQATGLAAADRGGTSDPFVTISYARSGKPLFNTRIRTKTVDPVFQETAFLLVAPDELRDHERIRLAVWDADRLSADDPLGKVDVSLAKLCRRSMHGKKGSLDAEPGRASLLLSRTEKLQPYYRDDHVQGQLRYSIGFFPLVGGDEGAGDEGLQAQRELIRAAARRAASETPSTATFTPGPQSAMLPDRDQQQGLPRDAPDELAPFLTAFDRFVTSLGLPVDDEAVRQRKERRERVNRLVGMIEGEQKATLAPAQEVRPSGILCFHIHSLVGLDAASAQRSLGASKRLAVKQRYLSSDEQSASDSSGGKMPSSYVQVILNDEAIFRTRTKPLNPRPFINAGSERFVADWTRAQISFVVRDQRLRENDPILGIVHLRLADVFKQTCRYSSVHTLVGGLGWGKMRVTLVWRSAEVTIPRPLCGWNIGVLDVASCRVGGFPRHRFERDSAHLLFETVGGSLKTDEVSPVDDGQGSDRIAFEYPLGRSLRLPVRQRYPNFLYIHLRSASRGIGKAHPLAHGCIPLNRIEDGSRLERRVPLFVTNDWVRFEQDALRTTATSDQLAGQEATETEERPVLEELCSGSRLAANGQMPGDVASDGHIESAGFVDLTFSFQPGVAQEHRQSLSGDHELRYAYEAMVSLVDAGEREKPGASSSSRSHRRKASGPSAPAPDANSLHSRGNSMDRPRNLHIDTGVSGSGIPGERGGEQEEDEDALLSGSDAAGGEESGDDEREERWARRQAQHRQERGAAQSKAFRTMNWVATNAKDGLGRLRKAAGPQSKALQKMESEGVSHF